MSEKNKNAKDEVAEDAKNEHRKEPLKAQAKPIEKLNEKSAVPKSPKTQSKAKKEVVKAPKGLSEKNQTSKKQMQSNQGRQKTLSRNQRAEKIDKTRSNYGHLPRKRIKNIDKGKREC